MDRVFILLIGVALGIVIGQLLPEPESKVEIGGFDIKIGPVTEQKEEQ